MCSYRPAAAATTNWRTPSSYSKRHMCFFVFISASASRAAHRWTGDQARQATGSPKTENQRAFMLTYIRHANASPIQNAEIKKCTYVASRHEWCRGNYCLTMGQPKCLPTENFLLRQFDGEYAHPQQCIACLRNESIRVRRNCSIHGQSNDH